jgi:hypothetical protein
MCVCKFVHICVHSFRRWYTRFGAYPKYVHINTFMETTCKCFDVNASYKSGCQFEKLSVAKIRKILKRYKIYINHAQYSRVAYIYIRRVGVYASANKNGSRKYSRSRRVIYGILERSIPDGQSTLRVRTEVILCRI